MSEISFAIANRQVATVRLDPNSVQGRDTGGLPQLYLPLKLQLLPAGQSGDIQYTIVRLAGTLHSQQIGEFATFEVAPLAALPNPTPYERQQDANVPLDRLRIRRFEDARAGNDAHFHITLSCLVWYPAEHRFETPFSSGNLDVVVPKSHWAERIVPSWNLSNIRIVEVRFPKDGAGDHVRASYSRVEEAEKLFANGQYKQVLTTLRLAFEALANGLGYERRVRECFESLFAATGQDKREKARDALTSLYRFLHLGPHEQNGGADGSTTVITQQDARFALISAYAIFEYITTKN